MCRRVPEVSLKSGVGTVFALARITIEGRRMLCRVVCIESNPIDEMAVAFRTVRMGNAGGFDMSVEGLLGGERPVPTLRTEGHSKGTPKATSDQ